MLISSVSFETLTETRKKKRIQNYRDAQGHSDARACYERTTATSGPPPAAAAVTVEKSRGLFLGTRPRSVYLSALVRLLRCEAGQLAVPRFRRLGMAEVEAGAVVPNTCVCWRLPKGCRGTSRGYACPEVGVGDAAEVDPNAVG